MSARENLEVHRRWADDNDRHDLSRYHFYMHDDIEVHHMGADTIVGLGAVRENMARSIETLPDRRVLVDEAFATDDRVVCRWKVTWGSPADVSSDDTITAVGVSVWEFDEGRARRGWIYATEWKYLEPEAAP